MDPIAKFRGITCSHGSLPPSSNYCRHKVDFHFTYIVYERLVLHHVDGTGQTLVTPITSHLLSDASNSVISRSIDPWCPHCHRGIFTLFKSSLNNCESCCNDYVRQLQDEVEDKLSQSVEPRDHHHRFEWILVSYRDTVCYHDNYDEVLNAWVERVSFEEAAKCTPASEASIEGLERSVIKDNEDTDCVICLEGLHNNNDRTLKVTMPCKHEFHEGCIVEWLRISHVCPLCRFELPAAANRVFLGTIVSANSSIQVCNHTISEA